ncbi:hypothetical protein ADUPG1_006790 [Aduncisulcus paluster]|uniref:Uncharacterized protein n=1 Tax=Aduncisulcus paluster TaxID=2918883 RepID=A0ABQ5KL95_9EUKA|nr:hypothetical protein ADUPG1_006790 [Aduncisulcus paluster]
MSIAEDEIDFGSIRTHSKHTRVFVIQNPHSVPINFNVSVPHVTFSADPSQGIVGPLSAQTVTVSAFSRVPLQFPLEQSKSELSGDDDARNRLARLAGNEDVDDHPGLDNIDIMDDLDDSGTNSSSLFKDPSIYVKIGEEDGKKIRVRAKIEMHQLRRGGRSDDSHRDKGQGKGAFPKLDPEWTGTMSAFSCIKLETSFLNIPSPISFNASSSFTLTGAWLGQKRVSIRVFGSGKRIRRHVTSTNKASIERERGEEKAAAESERLSSRSGTASTRGSTRKRRWKWLELFEDETEEHAELRSRIQEEEEEEEEEAGGEQEKGEKKKKKKKHIASRGMGHGKTQIEEEELRKEDRMYRCEGVCITSISIQKVGGAVSSALGWERGSNYRIISVSPGDVFTINFSVTPVSVGRFSGSISILSESTGDNVVCMVRGECVEARVNTRLLQINVSEHQLEYRDETIKHGSSTSQSSLDSYSMSLIRNQDNALSVLPCPVSSLSPLRSSFLYVNQPLSVLLTVSSLSLSMSEVCIRVECKAGGMDVSFGWGTTTKEMAFVMDDYGGRVPPYHPQAFMSSVAVLSAGSDIFLPFTITPTIPHPRYSRGSSADIVHVLLLPSPAPESSLISPLNIGSSALASSVSLANHHFGISSTHLTLSPQVLSLISSNIEFTDPEHSAQQPGPDMMEDVLTRGLGCDHDILGGSRGNIYERLSDGIEHILQRGLKFHTYGELETTVVDSQNKKKSIPHKLADQDVWKHSSVLTSILAWPGIKAFRIKGSRIEGFPKK